MAANVETMFYIREKPWHGLGTMVAEAQFSAIVISLAGLDWQVIQKSIKTACEILIPGFNANLRDTDNRVLGVVTDRYKVVQNEDAFAFTDALFPLAENATKLQKKNMKRLRNDMRLRYFEAPRKASRHASREAFICGKIMVICFI